MRTACRAPAAIALAGLLACGPSPQDLVDDLADGEAREAARQELLLAKDRAVGPLLAALDDPARAACRPVLVEVLASLMMRVDDARLPQRLAHLLRTDPDPGLRALVARAAGLHGRAELADALLDALDDGAGPVRHAALLALTGMEGRLAQAQKGRLDAHRDGLLRDPYPAVRLEGLILDERSAGEQLQQAGRAVLEARLADAESLYRQAVREHPYSRRARYRQARFHYDNGDRAQGLALLRAGGMLLDVPRLARAPVIDGRLDEAVWQTAARADSFYQLSFNHEAALPTQNPATMWVGYDDGSLYVGFRGHDEHPDSLVAKFTDAASAERADTEQGGLRTEIWTDDIIEIFLDADFDHRDYAHMGINSCGVRVDEWIKGSQQEIFQRGGSGADWNDAAWRADDEVAARVGQDHWSAEYRLRFGGDEFPRPRKGTVWGFNLVRVYRGQEYSQWVRTYAGGHSPDDFGVLLFQ